MTFKKIAIIGCGLIGGSLAKKIHSLKPNITLIGVSSQAKQLQHNKDASCFTRVIPSIQELDHDCDLVFVSVPIDYTVSTIKTLSNIVNEHCIITDVASIKENIEKALNESAIQQPVILGHPMAGKAETGFSVSDAALFDNAPYFLIKNDSPAYRQLSGFLQSLQVTIIETSAKEHDIAVSLSSHLPYIMAATTISALNDTSDEITGLVKSSYGPGFKDTTRVAGSDPKWGRAICEDNNRNISQHLDRCIQTLQNIKEQIDSKQYASLEQQFSHIKHLKQAITRNENA